MQPELVPAPAPVKPPNTVNFIFFNDRGLRAGWRLVIFLVILSITSFIFGSIYRLLAQLFRGPSPERAALSPLWMSMGELSVFLAVVAATFIMSRPERRPVGTYGLPITKSAWPRFLTGYVFWGFLPLTLVLGIMRALGVFYFGAPSLTLTAALRWGFAWAAVFILVGLFEEYSFRGYALYTLADGIGFWPAAIILALLFGVVHMGNGGESYIGIMGTVLFALFASATLRRTGNLWLAVGAHAGWDWGESFFYGVSDSGLQAPGHLFNPLPPQGPAWLSGGTVGPEGSIVVLIVWALMTTGVLFFWQRKEMPKLETGQEPSVSM